MMISAMGYLFSEVTSNDKSTGVSSNTSLMCRRDENR